MKIERFKFKITGLGELLLNSPASMGRSDGSIKQKKIPTPEEEAAAKVYKLANGQLYLPSIQFRQSLLHAVGGKKVGKRTARSIIAAAVFNCTDKTLLVDQKTCKPIKDYEIDVRRAVVQHQGIVRARPKVSDWACELELDIDTDLCPADTVADNLNEAGTMSGVGDYRPSTQGWFGRFTASLIEE